MDLKGGRPGWGGAGCLDSWPVELQPRIVTLDTLRPSSSPVLGDHLSPAVSLELCIVAQEVRGVLSIAWEHRRERPRAGVLKGVSDPGPRAEPWPCHCIRSLGPCESHSGSGAPVTVDQV